MASASPVRSEKRRKTIMDALVCTHKRRLSATPGAHARGITKLRQCVWPPMATPLARAPATDMETDSGDVQRQRKDMLGGLLSKFEFDGETKEVNLTAEDWLLLREACKKRKLE